MLRGFWGLMIVALLVRPGQAEVQTKNVSYKHGDVQLQGYLAWDDASDAKRPGVLVVHEWWGLNDYAKERARMLAKLGYVAFAADMYGEGKVTTDPSEAAQWAGHMRGDVENWKGRALAGLKVLREHPLTQQDNLAAIGYCFGGSTVLALALAGTDLEAVVSFHGALPKTSPEEAQAAAKSDVSILIAHGADDGFIPEESIKSFREALDKAKVQYRFVAYPNAKHSFTNPGADKYGVEGVEYNKAADEQSWADMKALFNKTLK